MLLKMLNVSQFVVDTFPTLRAILLAIVALACIIMIIAILVSPPQTGIGSNPITGANESYYTKNRGANNQGRIRNLVIICAIVIAVCSILFGISYTIYQPSIGA